MKRRNFIAGIGSAAAAWPLSARAQQAGRMRRVGVLTALAESDPEAKAQIAAFRKGLQERGWLEGRNVEIEFRHADGKPERLPHLALELVRTNVDVVVTHGTPAVQALQKANPAIAIVFATIGDPIGAGIVASLARPGGNVTGLSLIATDLGTKRLEILKEALPHLRRVAMLSIPQTPALSCRSAKPRLPPAYWVFNSTLSQ